MSKANIRAILKSKGWNDILAIIEKERDTAPEIDSAKSAEEIGKEFMAYDLARKKIDKIITTLNTIADQEERQAYTYK